MQAPIFPIPRIGFDIGRDAPFDTPSFFRDTPNRSSVYAGNVVEIRCRESILLTYLGTRSILWMIFHRFDEGVHDSGCQVSPGLPGLAFAHGSSFTGSGLAGAGLGVDVDGADAEAF
jgi:hypothetical protein